MKIINRLGNIIFNIITTFVSSNKGLGHRVVAGHRAVVAGIPSFNKGR